MSVFHLSLTFTNILKLLVIIFIFFVLFVSFNFIKTLSSSFQKYLIIFTLVVLIICLIIIGATIQKSKSSGDWPPEYPECPDYFNVINSTETGAICKNTKKLGLKRCHGIADFTGSTFSGKYGLCNKYKWADNCKVSWDGITYGKDNPCSDLDN